MGHFTDLVEIFFLNLSGVRIFSPRHKRYKIFFSIIRYERYFFQCRVFFPRNLFACFFPPEISLQDIFFLKSPITPSKVKWSAPKIHQTFSQLTDSDLSIISKGFWNNRGQNSQVERGGIRFYLPLPGKSVRSYIRITKFSRMGSLPNFITHGAPLRALRARRLRYNAS